MNRTTLVSLVFLTLAPAAFSAVAVYPYRMDPRRHPDDARRWVKPPDAKVFGNSLQFMGALRDLDERTWKEDLDRIVEKDGMGRIIWANSGILANANLEEQVKELARRGYYLFDIWGFVPELTDPDNSDFRKNPRRRYGGDFRPKPEILAMFERELGERWLGMDNGEQDGRYVNTPGYAKLYEPLGVDRVGQYKHFDNHFEAMNREHGNRMAALVSATFGHYFLKSGCYTSAGAETAQALPNSQIYYSFLRGAGKQYGVPWFGNVSVFNRWGCKGYKIDPSTDGCPGFGPENGTSLALLKKLMYAQILYNSFAVGFECSHYQYKQAKSKGEGEGSGELELSPIGRIQKGAAKWYEANGDPGTLHAPVALLFDFYAGWANPRYLYCTAGDGFRCWGVLPYDLSDHFADGVLSLLYPGYDDAGYFHDERGFNADTPYGDIADCLLSDASAETLSQYPLVVLVSTMRKNAELADTLAKYVAQGGHLVLARGNARTLFPEGLPKGRVTVLGSEWGVVEEPQCGPIETCEKEAPLERPHPLTAEAKRTLDAAFREQMIFGLEKSEGLSLVTSRRGRGEYTVAVLNNTWTPKPMKLVAKAGRILSVTELPTEDDEKGVPGYAPNIYTNYSAGASTATQIAGGDIRIFRVRLDEADAVRELPEALERPNASGRVFVMRGNGDLKDAYLERPTFFRHYDTMLVDWRWFESRTDAEIVRQFNGPKTQGLKLMVDFRSGLNYYPDLRIDTQRSERRTRETLARMGDVLCKAATCGITEAIVSEDRGKDSPKQVEALDDGFRRLLALPEAKGFTFHQCGHVFREYRYSVKEDWHPSANCYSNACARAERLATPRFKPAYRVAAELFLRKDAAAVAAEIAEKKPSLVFLAAPATDRNGKLISQDEPFASWPDAAGREAILTAIRAAGSRVVYDALYADQDDEYRNLVE